MASTGGALGWGALLTVWGLAWSAAGHRGDHPALQSAAPVPLLDRRRRAELTRRRRTSRPPSVLAQFGALLVPKLRTTLLILLPVAFLALGSPLALVACRAWRCGSCPRTAAYWGTGYHYNATVMPIVFIAAIDSAGPDPRRTGPSPRRERRTTAGLGARPGRSLAATRVVPGAHAGDRGGARLRSSRSATCGTRRPTRSARTSGGRTPPWPGCPPGTTVEATLTMLAPLAARDDTYWIGNAGNPAPRYIVFDDLDSGWSPPPSNPLTFVEQRHPGRHLPADLREQLRLRVPPGRHRIGGVPASR